MNIEFYKNLDYIRTKHYNIEKQYIYDEWVNYYDEHLNVLYMIFSKYYSVPYDRFVKIIYDTQ